MWRSSGTATLNTHVCEKTLFDSFSCVESSFADSQRPGSWRPIQWVIDIDKLSPVNGVWRICPVTLAFSVSGADGWVEVVKIRLEDGRHENLLRNADFQSGSTCWFFTSDDHSSWRAENVWGHLYIEQGWFGVVSFAWLVVGTLLPLVRRAVTDQDLTLYALAVAIVGFLTMGMFGSLLDTPWITQSLCALLGVSQARTSILPLPQRRQPQPW
jgi:hypothetical protein